MGSPFIVTDARAKTIAIVAMVSSDRLNECVIADAGYIPLSRRKLSRARIPAKILLKILPVAAVHDRRQGGKNDRSCLTSLLERFYCLKIAEITFV
ncbi:hypothetical protein [Desulfosarcina sp. BuS5]|uniref:hypothetical protein n=1 Tax=Desulfosarcina sp. BuS5 TaxID=933262 RepID=UPI00054ED110|nr:hypothetical protein [Desulfosarcina sp. BuS5]